MQDPEDWDQEPGEALKEKGNDLFCLKQYAKAVDKCVLGFLHVCINVTLQQESASCGHVMSLHRNCKSAAWTFISGAGTQILWHMSQTLQYSTGESCFGHVPAFAQNWVFSWHYAQLYSLQSSRVWTKLLVVREMTTS